MAHFGNSIDGGFKVGTLSSAGPVSTRRLCCINVSYGSHWWWFRTWHAACEGYDVLAAKAQDSYRELHLPSSCDHSIK